MNDQKKVPDVAEKGLKLKDSLKEFFRLGKVIKELQSDLRDALGNSSKTDEIVALQEKIKNLKEDRANDPVISDIKDDIDKFKAELILHTDIIIELMVELGEEEVYYEGSGVKLTNKLKKISGQQEMFENEDQIELEVKNGSNK